MRNSLTSMTSFLVRSNRIFVFSPKIVQLKLDIKGGFFQDFCRIIRLRKLSAIRTSFGVRNEPLQCDVNVVFLFAGNGIAADFSVLNGVQVHLLNEAILVQSVW